jgi:Flp pilus assembly protein TadB
MQTQSHNASDNAGPAERDTIVHRSLRVIQRILRVLLVISAVTTGVFLLFLGPLVVAPAIVMAACYVSVLAVNFLTRKTRPGAGEAHMEPIFDTPAVSDTESQREAQRKQAPQRRGERTSKEGDESVQGPRADARARRPARKQPPRHQVREAGQKTGAKVLLAIVATLILISVLLAAILLERRLIAIGAFAFFAFLLVTGVPVWYAAVQEEVDDARAEITGKTPPTSH